MVQLLSKSLDADPSESIEKNVEQSLESAAEPSRSADVEIQKEQRRENEVN